MRWCELCSWFLMELLKLHINMILKTQYGYVADCGAMTAVAYSFGVTRRPTLISWVSELIQNYLHVVFLQINYDRYIFHFCMSIIPYYSSVVFINMETNWQGLDSISTFSRPLNGWLVSTFKLADCECPTAAQFSTSHVELTSRHAPYGISYVCASTTYKIGPNRVSSFKAVTNCNCRLNGWMADCPRIPFADKIISQSKVYMIYLKCSVVHCSFSFSQRQTPCFVWATDFGIWGCR